MKSNFFLITLLFLMDNQAVFSQAAPSQAAPVGNPILLTPSMQVSRDVATQIFLDQSNRILNCPKLFDNSWSYPNAYCSTMCDEAKTACYRYGLVVRAAGEAQKAEIPNQQLLTQLQQAIGAEREEVTRKLRGCVLTIEYTISGSATLNEAAGFPADAYGPRNNN